MTILFWYRYFTNGKLLSMYFLKNSFKNVLAPLWLVVLIGGCATQEPNMKLKRASFNRCIYDVDNRDVSWDVRAFVDKGNPTEGEEFIVAMNLVVEDYEDQGPYSRIFQLKKVQVYFGTEKVYQGKDFDHKEWLGPSLGTTSNMLRLDKDLLKDRNLSVVLLVQDDLNREYRCEAGGIKLGEI